MNRGCPSDCLDARLYKDMRAHSVWIGSSIISLIGLLSPNSELFGAWLHKTGTHPSPEPRDRIATLNERLENGAVKLVFQPTSGYLRSILEKLDIMVESQVMV